MGRLNPSRRWWSREEAGPALARGPLVTLLPFGRRGTQPSGLSDVTNSSSRSDRKTRAEPRRGLIPRCGFGGSADLLDLGFGRRLSEPMKSLGLMLPTSCSASSWTSKNSSSDPSARTRSTTRSPSRIRRKRRSRFGHAQPDRAPRPERRLRQRTSTQAQPWFWSREWLCATDCGAFWGDRHILISRASERKG